MAHKALPNPNSKNKERGKHLDFSPGDQEILLKFENDEDVHRAITLLWKPPLISCPHHLTPDGIVIPVRAIKHFRAAGLKFSQHAFSER